MGRTPRATKLACCVISLLFVFAGGRSSASASLPADAPRTSALQASEVAQDVPQPAPALALIGSSAGQLTALAGDDTTVYVAEQRGTLRTLTALDITAPPLLKRSGSLELVGPIKALAFADHTAYIGTFRGDYPYTGVLLLIDASDSANLHQRAELALDGVPIAIQVVGTRAYVTLESHALQIIDLTNRDQPVSLSTVPLSQQGYCQDLAIVTTLVLIACEGVGLQIVDAADPAHPQVLPTYTPPGFGPRSVAVDGSRVYLGMFTSGLLVLDITNPRAPAQVGQWTGESLINDLAVVAGRAYLTGATGVDILDVRDPHAIQPLAYVATGGAPSALTWLGSSVATIDSGGLRILDPNPITPPTPRGSVSGLGTFQQLAVADGYAYVVSGKYDAPIGGALQVVSVADVDHPAVQRTVQFDSPMLEIAVHGSMAYLGGESGLTLADISDPLSPTVRSSLPVGAAVQGLDVDGDLVALCAGVSLVLVDVHTPSAPTRLGSIGFSFLTSHVQLVGGYAYVTVDARLFVVDVRDPTHPLILSQYPPPDSLSGLNIRNLDVADGIATLALSNTSTSRLETIDVHDPLHLRPLGQLTLKGGLEDVARVNGQIYLAHGSDGLTVVDAPDIGDLHTSIVTPLLGSTARIKVVDGRAYTLRYGDNGLHIFDLANSAGPQFRSRYDTFGEVYEAARVGDLVYALVRNEGLVVLDISAPATPRRLRRLSFPFAPQGLRVQASWAYVSAGQTFHVLDISTPQAPIIVSSLAIPNAGALGRPSLVGTLASVSYVDGAFLGGGIALISLSDPLKPELLKIIGTGRSPTVDMRGALLYAYNGALVVYDVHDPAAPQPLGSVVVDGFNATFADDGLVYISTAQGIQIVDARDPLNPALRGSVAAPRALRALAVDGQRLYATDETSLLLFDRTDPLAPTLRAQAAVAQPRTLTTFDDRLIVGRLYGLELLRVVPEQFFSTATVDASGGHLVSADGTVQLDFPAGALPSTSVLTYTPLLNTSPASTGPRIVRSFLVEGRTATGQPIMQLSRPITLTIAYTTDDLTGAGVEEATLTIDQYGENGWLPLPVCAACNTSVARTELRATSDSLGTFALRGQALMRVWLPLVLR